MVRPNKAEKKYLTLAYNYFYDIYYEVLADSFWRKPKYYRFNRIKEAFSIYAELLNYIPLQWVIESLKKQRPPMEAEIGSGVFKFIRNVVVHFPFYKNWDEVWIDKDLVNWFKDGMTIDRFLKKYNGHEPVKYRMWEAKKKKMTYLSINFPANYVSGQKVYLKEILKEYEGVRFSVVFMRRMLDTQVDSGK